MRDYVELTKPSVTWLILMSTGVGYFFGARTFDQPWLLAFTLAGTALIAAGTFTLNQWMESDVDARMRRTAQRPLAAGRLSPVRALVFGIALALAGFAVLWLGVNLLTALLGAFTLASYLFLYTPLKRRTPHATTIGAIPGAMPPLMGFAAARGELTAEGWALYAILFVWQFPHFQSIAWLYRDDYARAGIRMLPVVEPDGRSTARQIVAGMVLLIPISALPTLLDMSGRIYLAGAVALGLYFLYTGWRVASERSSIRARGVLMASVIYLPLLYGLMLLDRPGL